MKYQNPDLFFHLEGYWIGGRRFNDTAWIWDKNGDQEPIVSFDWAPSEPKSNASCIQMWIYYGNQWDDIHCDNKRRFLCQIRI